MDVNLFTDLVPQKLQKVTGRECKRDCTLSQKFLEDCKPRIDSAMLARKQLQCYFLGSGAMKVTTSHRKRMQR
jgi:hypothetical protein